MLKLKVAFFISLGLEVIIVAGYCYHTNYINEAGQLAFLLLILSWLATGVSGILLISNFVYNKEGISFLGYSITGFMIGLGIYFWIMFFFHFAVPIFAFPIRILVLLFTMVNISIIGRTKYKRTVKNGIA